MICKLFDSLSKKIYLRQALRLVPYTIEVATAKSIQEIATKLGSGLWTERVSQLLAMVVSRPFSKQDRLWLEEQIQLQLGKGRLGKACNYLLLGLACDKDRWIRWIRRSGLLRTSKYDYNPKQAMFIAGELLQASSGLGLDKETNTYLSSVLALARTAPVFGGLQHLLINELKSGAPTIIKGLLAIVDLGFMLRSQRGIPDVIGLDPEDLAEGFSLLLYLYTEKLHFAFSDPGPINLDAALKNTYLDLLKTAIALRKFNRWEILIDYFDYRCTYDTASNSLLINAPSVEFAKSFRWGYIHHFQQQVAMARQFVQDKAASLKTYGTKLRDLMEQKNLIERKYEPIERWVFAFPDTDIIHKVIPADEFFEEEVAWLMSLSKDLFVPFEELLRIEVLGIQLSSLVRAHRYVNLIRQAGMSFLADKLEKNPRTVLQSLLPVMQGSLLRGILNPYDPKEAETILNMLTWRPASHKVFDTMYQPFIPASGGYYIVPLNVLGSADFVRNTLMLTQTRAGGKGVDRLGEFFANVLKKVTEFATHDVTYKYAGEEGDIDSTALIDDVLFVFECKNSLHPASTFELRTSFDALLFAQEQLDRFLRLWSDPGFRVHLSNRLGWDLSGVSRVGTGIVTGNRMFGGLRFGKHAVRPFHEIANFILSGEILIFDQPVVLRPAGKLKKEVLEAYLVDDPVHEKNFSAMERNDEHLTFGSLDVTVEDYTLNGVALAKAFGVAVPAEEKVPN
jgi:hypothetical protein